MMAAALSALCPAPAYAGKPEPEPLDADFLDYLAACEGKDDNWTVVQDEKKGAGKAARKDPPKKPAPDPEAPKPEEAKP